MSKILVFVAWFAGLGLCVVKAPHMRLAAQLAAGELEGRPIPVAEFVPEVREQEAIPLRCGHLLLQAPPRTRIEPGSPEDASGLLLRLEGLTCRILPPRYETNDDTLGVGALNETRGEDDLSREAAICAASGRDLSFWMSVSAVRLLRERLEIRPVFCLSAERVEVIRGETLSGLLLTWKVEGLPRMVFTYSSPDNRIRGRAFFFLESDAAEGMRAARAIVSTLSLQLASAAGLDTGQP